MSSLGELGKTGRECCFIIKKLAYGHQKEGITKETVLCTKLVKLLSHVGLFVTPWTVVY